MNEHTKEPWRVMGPCAQRETARIFSGARYIGSIGNSDETESETRANARRIVACVNACAGIGTEWLEKNAAIFQSIVADMQGVSCQRDELLAAAKTVQPYHDDSMFNDEWVSSHPVKRCPACGLFVADLELLSAAIANAEGGEVKA